MTLQHSLLIVEDNQELLEIYSRWFVRRGHDVTATHHPLRAIELAQRKDFSIAVADYGLPGMTGCELMRQLMRLADIDVIILSGCDNLAAEGEASESGAFAWLMKPCSLSDLAVVVENAMEQHTTASKATLKDRS